MFISRKSGVQICNKTFFTVVARVMTLKMALDGGVCYLLEMSTKKEKLDVT